MNDNNNNQSNSNNNKLPPMSGDYANRITDKLFNKFLDQTFSTIHSNGQSHTERNRARRQRQKQNRQLNRTGVTDTSRYLQSSGFNQSNNTVNYGKSRSNIPNIDPAAPGSSGVSAQLQSYIDKSINQRLNKQNPSSDVESKQPAPKQKVTRSDMSLLELVNSMAVNDNQRKELEEIKEAIDKNAQQKLKFGDDTASASQSAPSLPNPFFQVDNNKKGAADSLSNIHGFLKSVIFPEYGDPQKLPGMGLTAIGKWWTNLTITPTANGQVTVIFLPQNINANNNIIFYNNGAQSYAQANYGVVAAPYIDRTILDRSRITSAGIMVRCVNPTNQNASGMIAVSYQPKLILAANNNFSTYTSQHDVEMAVTEYNGTLTDVNSVGKAIWLPIDVNDLTFKDGGWGGAGDGFIAAVISNSNVNTTFRFDFYVNYEYLPGTAIENVVTTERPHLKNDSQNTNIYATAGDMLSNNGTTFLGDNENNIHTLLPRAALSIGSLLPGIGGAIAKAASYVDTLTDGGLTNFAGGLAGKALDKAMGVFGLAKSSKSVGWEKLLESTAAF